MINKTALAGVGIGATLLLTPHASADPNADPDGRVKTQIPSMLCEIGTSDTGPNGSGPGVVCQGIFPQAPTEPPIPPYPGWNGDPASLRDDQAIVTAAGQFSYRNANIGVGDNPSLDTLVPGQTYHVRGWTIAGTDADITFTSDATGHGMTIASDGSVKPF
jgi:hypothetical protein